MNKKIIAAITGATLLGALCTAQAAGNGERIPSNSLRVGMYFIEYDVKGSDLAGQFTPPGLQSDLKNVQTLYVAYVRRLSSHFDLELAAGIPPKTTAIGKGPAYLGSVPFNNQEVLTARWLSPTLLLNYELLDETHRLRPYIGVGVNHTSFYERRATAAGEAITGGPTSVSLSSSTGIAGTIGVGYQVRDAWHLYASYSMSKVTSDLRTVTAGVVRTSHIDFGPRAFVAAVGYSF